MDIMPFYNWLVFQPRDLQYLCFQDFNLQICVQFLWVILKLDAHFRCLKLLHNVHVVDSNFFCHNFSMLLMKFKLVQEYIFVTNHRINFLLYIELQCLFKLLQFLQLILDNVCISLAAESNNFQLTGLLKDFCNFKIVSGYLCRVFFSYLVVNKAIIKITANFQYHPANFSKYCFSLSRLVVKEEIVFSLPTAPDFTF